MPPTAKGRGAKGKPSRKETERVIRTPEGKAIVANPKGLDDARVLSVLLAAVEATRARMGEPLKHQ